MLKWKEIALTQDAARLEKIRETLSRCGIDYKTKYKSRMAKAVGMKGSTVTAGIDRIGNNMTYYVYVEKKNAEYAAFVVGGVR